MQAFENFRDMDASFWAFIKYVSENLGYSIRGKGSVKAYSSSEIVKLCEKYGINASEDIILKTEQYTTMRANLLNSFVRDMLMDAETANEEFRKLEVLHRNNNYYCSLPLNKQKGDKRQVAFFTAIIKNKTEKTIREITGNTHSLGFDDDPHNLSYILDDNGKY